MRIRIFVPLVFVLFANSYLAMQELSIQNEKQQQRIEYLIEKNSELEGKIEAMERK
jgi:cell division protein FtsB